MQRGGGEGLQRRANWGAAAGRRACTHARTHTRARRHARPRPPQHPALCNAGAPRTRPDCGRAPRTRRAAPLPSPAGPESRGERRALAAQPPALPAPPPLCSRPWGRPSPLPPPGGGGLFGEEILPSSEFLKWMFARRKAAWKHERGAPQTRAAAVVQPLFPAQPLSEPTGRVQGEPLRRSAWTSAPKSHPRAQPSRRRPKEEMGVGGRGRCLQHLESWGGLRKRGPPGPESCSSSARARWLRPHPPTPSPVRLEPRCLAPADRLQATMRLCPVNARGGD